VSRLAAAAVAAVGFVAGVFPIFDGDIFWHLAAGRWIAEHGELPRLDPFRFTAPGARWIDHEWLFQLSVHGLVRAVGLDGLILARGAALAGFGLAVFAAARRAALAADLAGWVALAAILGVRPRFLDRPEIVTLFAVVALLSLLEQRERTLAAVSGAPRSMRWQGLVAPLALVVVWVNFHGEALLAPVLAGLFLLGAALVPGVGARDGLRRRAAEIAGVPLLCAAALLANPHGWRLLEVPHGIRGALTELAAVNPEWLSAFRAPQPFLFGGMAAVAALAAAARARLGRWPAPGWGLATLALGAVALTAVRHQALFYAAGAPFAARCLGAWPEAREAAAPARRRRVAGLAAGALALGAWCVAPPVAGPLRPRHGGLAWGLGLAEGRFPVRAAARLAERPEIGPLYNEFAHGGFLLWRLHPPRRVFLDGRMELDPGLLHELAAARRSAESWGDLLRRRGAVGALVRYEARAVTVFELEAGGAARPVESRTPNAFLFPTTSWDLVYWDDEAMLFLVPGTPGWDESPYRFVQPEDAAWTLRRASADREFRAAALAEIERKLAEQPDCRRAADLRRRLLAAATS